MRGFEIARWSRNGIEKPERTPRDLKTMVGEIGTKDSKANAFGICKLERAGEPLSAVACVHYAAA